MKALNDDIVRNEFEAAFSANLAGIAHAPGRVNLIGEHTDYNLGFVLPAAIDLGTWVAFRPLAGRVVEAVDLSDLAEKVEIAGEKDFADLFSGCELGAMPPFGNLYGMKVFVAEKLAEDEEICFNAGTHRELIRLKYADFERLVKPVKAEFAVS